MTGTSVMDVYTTAAEMREKLLVVPCARCHAAVGDDCRTSKGGVAHWPHSARYHAHYTYERHRARVESNLAAAQNVLDRLPSLSPSDRITALTEFQHQYGCAPVDVVRKSRKALGLEAV